MTAKGEGDMARCKDMQDFHVHTQKFDHSQKGGQLNMCPAFHFPAPIIWTKRSNTQADGLSNRLMFLMVFQDQ